MFCLLKTKIYAIKNAWVRHTHVCQNLVADNFNVCMLRVKTQYIMSDVKLNNCKGYIRASSRRMTLRKSGAIADHLISQRRGALVSIP